MLKDAVESAGTQLISSRRREKEIHELRGANSILGFTQPLCPKYSDNHLLVTSATRSPFSDFTINEVPLKILYQLSTITAGNLHRVICCPFRKIMQFCSPLSCPFAVLDRWEWRALYGIFGTPGWGGEDDGMDPSIPLRSSSEGPGFTWKLKFLLIWAWS